MKRSVQSIKNRVPTVIRATLLLLNLGGTLISLYAITLKRSLVDVARLNLVFFQDVCFKFVRLLQRAEFCPREAESDVSLLELSDPAGM